jgi:hypothetical protein
MHMRGSKGKAWRALPWFSVVVQVLQLGREEVPVVQHLLQPGGDAGRIMRRAQVARDDDQLAVARAVLVGGEFHGDRTFVLVKIALAPRQKLRIVKLI